MSWNGHERNVLLRNEGIDDAGLPRFTHVGIALGAADRRDARGLAVADLDNDGDLDLSINNNPGNLADDPAHTRATVLRNDVGNRRHWLAVSVQGTTSNRDGIGAVVRITAGRQQQTRYVTSGGGYASQHSTRLYFGLGEATNVEELTVQWPSGLHERFENIGARQLAHLTEARGIEVQPLPAKGNWLQTTHQDTTSTRTAQKSDTRERGGAR